MYKGNLFNWLPQKTDKDYKNAIKQAERVLEKYL